MPSKTTALPGIAATAGMLVAIFAAGCTATETPPDQDSARSITSMDQFAEVRRDPGRGTVIFAKAYDLGQELQADKKYAQLKEKQAYRDMAQYLLDAYRDDLRLDDPASELMPGDVQVDQLGYRQIKFDQHYRQLPVVDCQLIVQVSPAGDLHLMQGRYAPTPRLSNVSPALSESEVTKIIVSRPVYSDHAGHASLAYDVQVDQGSFEAARVIVDANTGAELRKTPTSYTTAPKRRAFPDRTESKVPRGDSK
jgi:Zn-dependent metalloprotease